MTAGAVRPSGTVTFLFTDIEGSTRRWEADPDSMRLELAKHDEVLRDAIEAHGGWLFKHTGDGVCAAFSSAPDAVAAAIDAQAALQLPVRMGVGTGSAELRGDDYFGPALNRAARVMAAGHGGQILVAASTAGLVDGRQLEDLGEHRLRDLSGAHRLFQVRAEGLRIEFPPLRTLDAVPGNLPHQTTSFVGREIEVKELAELVRAHELVTLTGVGGVGKTRLAIQVAAELMPEFPDGVWLVELAPVGDPAAVPDVVATVLGIVPQAGRTVTQSIVDAMVGRRQVVVLDNCEHVLDAAADLVEVILGRATTVKVIATSREGLRTRGEHLWPVPSLGARSGTASAAVDLFVERAQAAVPTFTLTEPADAEAVTELCRRLDGIALAIELAAARMVSMSPVEALELLTDRFRLLSGSRRGLERHQTLRQAVQWSYDLLSDDERTVLQHCAVFSGGFDRVTAARLCQDFDEYTVLDVLDSLVRKSLVTTERVGGHTRYGMLETIRQFAEDQLAATGTIEQVRDRHARWFAAEATARWLLWEGPRQRVAVDWVDAEFANLRTGFRWATDRGDLDTAAAVAAHTAMVAGFNLQIYEPIGWIEEILGAAAAGDLALLPRLYTAAGFCSWTGRAADAVEFLSASIDLQAQPGFDPFEPVWSRTLLGSAHLFAGRPDRFLEIAIGMTGMESATARALGLCTQVWCLPSLGRTDEAAALADDAIAAATASGNPWFLCYALGACGRAFAHTDPPRALAAFRRSLLVAQENRAPIWEGLAMREAAGLEALHGSVDEALSWFRLAIDSFHRAGDDANLAVTLANLALFFDHVDRPETAATVYGASTREGATAMVIGLPATLDRLRGVLGSDAFDAAVTAGAAKPHSDAVQYARAEIDRAARELGASS